jgi:predicted CoA-binding protein
VEPIPPDGLTDEEIKQILSLKRVAVVGMSRDPAKPAHYVPKYLLERGYEIIPVNPTADVILGLRVYKSLKEVPGPVDIVDVFRPSEAVPEVVREAVSVRPKVIWLQEGIYHPEAVEVARANGIRIVWNRCMMKEHRRLSG